MALQWLSLASLAIAQVSSLNVGVGIADMTGPAAQINFMGYGNTQKGEGIHFRLRARAFVIDDGKKHVAFVSMDTGMGSDVLNKRVVEELDKKLPGMYSYDNVCLSGTHTHSGPGGFLQYVMVEVPTMGFVEETTKAMVDGVVSAIIKAHKNLAPGTIKMANGNLLESNINRSPTSYLLNPAAERAEYEDEGNTDKNMLLLRFDSADGKPLGVLNWFAVHGTSMNNTNHLVSGDNRGYASYLFERKINGKDVLTGQGDFVAAFASTNLGDVSPNTAGPRCVDTGLPCDKVHSTCHGKEELCVAFGPGTNGDMFESTKIIGNNQYEHALKLYSQATTEITGSVDFRHSFINLDGLTVTLEDGSTAKTCPAALGYAFAAGTTDGCGMFNFQQGTNSTNPFWGFVSHLLSKPTEEEVACQHPKPILLNLAGINFPYAWEAKQQPVQIFRIGNLVIGSPPGEMTTMAGRRFRKALAKQFAGSAALDGKDPVVAIAGLSNNYLHYITTYEEYQGQRYEAASTLHGPHQLSAFIQEFSRIADDMVHGRASSSLPAAGDVTSHQINFNPPVITDYAPFGKHFGQALTKPEAQYKAGSSVTIKFQSANPRNNVRLESSFLRVDLLQGSATDHAMGSVMHSGSDWKTVALDGDWETKFHWKAHLGGILPQSWAYITWDIPEDVAPGTYRICHMGDRKSATTLWKIEPFEGCSETFQVGAITSKKVDIFV